MALLEKLGNIHKPPVKPMTTGFSETAEDFWKDFILPRLPKKEIALQWHKVLMEYVNRPNATFALRFYNTATKDQYSNLRRGFLTKTDKGYSFFYTDNFHAAYYFKMALDSYVPTVNEIISAHAARKFPARFAWLTSEEKELAAVPNGRNPGFTTAGYKIAHIHNVGMDYHSNGCDLSLKDIVEKYFPRGERDDWQENADQYGKYFIRHLNVSDEARKYLVAEFLRFVHPFNYFLMPKMTGKKNLKAIWFSPGGLKDAAEYPPLTLFVGNKFAEIYGQAYEDFLKLIEIDKEYLSALNAKSQRAFSGDLVLKISYGIKPDEKDEFNTPPKVNNDGNSFAPIAKPSSEFPTEIQLKVLKEYLWNPNTSFRKLEMKIMGIPSPVRGGGFKAKSIVNSFGAYNDNKGMLSKCLIEDAIKIANDSLRETLIQYKDYLE